MPRILSNLPNEIILVVGDHLEVRDLHSLVRVSSQFFDLFLSRLNGLALKEENTHAAIYWAAASRNRAMLKRVLEEGENVALYIGSDVVHRSPRSCSERVLAWMLNGSPTIFLGERGSNRSRTGTIWAVRTCHQAVLKLLIERKKIGPHSMSQALTLAVSRGNEKATRLLLDQNAVSGDFFEPQRVFSELLQIATSDNHINLVKLLLEHGADVNAAEHFGPRREPLFRIAEEKGYTELTKFLVEKHIHADANFIDRIGKRSAVYLAVQFSDEALVRHALEKGTFIDTDLKGPWGNPPFKLAAERGDKEIIKLLACHSGMNCYMRTPETVDERDLETVDTGDIRSAKAMLAN